jgi:L-alanine-DL-glutamate epimerase-like enolase superfamily enzyme
MKIVHTKHAVIQEPLLSPFGFKGAYLSEIWQSIALLRGESGAEGMGVGVQSVLWSDARVFARFKEAEGNELMANMTRRALEMSVGQSFETPFELLDVLLPDVFEFGRRESGFSDLRATFALNALVTVDQAAWSLYRRETGRRFDELVPEQYRSALTAKHKQLGSIPLISYGLSEDDIAQVLDEGYFLLKIKIGADPDKDGDQEKMLEWDKQRLAQIHRIASRYSTEYTVNGKIAYYLDANGRYGSKDTVKRLLDFADKIGALERIVLFEEPFTEEDKTDISDLPVRFAADESVHSEKDALERIELGYGAMALKPVAKTMSLSLKIAKLAAERSVPCFCADLTVNPLLVDWNKNLAARLAPLPELKVGVLETNGHQNYRNWNAMIQAHPLAGAEWIIPSRGIFELSERFYEMDGGALDISPVYKAALDQGE